MESVKKSIDERALHKREYDSRVNERQMQTKEGKVDTSKALDANLVVKEKPVAEVDQDAEECHDTHPLLAKLTVNQIAELSHQSLESENICLKKTVAQSQKYFSKLKAHCINLELQLQNNVLKSGQHGQLLKAKSNEAKVKKDIDVFETINIELEHNVAKLLAENEQLNKEKEHFKQIYKDLYDSIKKTRVQTKDHNDSLIAQLDKKSIENADLKC
ncbi:hypothetical protein Tco_0103575 [Tanacetum coccineum]